MSVTLTDILRREIPAWRERAMRAEPMSGGMTNRNFRVWVDDHPYFVRWGSEQAEILGIDRENEYRANLIAATLQVAPAVETYLAGRRIFVIQHVAGRALEPADLATDDGVVQVARMLRRIHQAGRVARKFSVFEVVRSYVEFLRRSRTVPAAVASALRTADRMEAVVRDRLDCLCHNDLLAANFLRSPDQRLWLVDWEYAGMGMGLFDLANFSANQELSARLEERLIAAYYGELHGGRLAGLRLLRVMSDLREALWGYVQTQISSIAFDFEAYGERFLTRVASAMSSAQFAADWETARRDPGGDSGLLAEDHVNQRTGDGPE